MRRQLKCTTRSPDCKTLHVNLYIKWHFDWVCLQILETSSHFIAKDQAQTHGAIENQICLFW